MATDLILALPEILLAVFAMAALMAGAFGGGDARARPILWATAAFMALLGLLVAINPPATGTAFGGAFTVDAFARFAKAGVLFGAAILLLMSEDFMSRRGLLRFEFPVLIALATLGMMVMVSASDLMTLYMGIELQALALYVVAAIDRDSPRATEAGLKYFVLGALSSGLLLYGASLVYGHAGTTLFSGIVAAAAAEGTNLGLLLGLVLMLAGLAFKVSAVPFHMWTPDVYEGAPTPVTAFFATVPKLAALALFARVAHQAFGSISGDWGQIVAFLSVASMLLGAVAAIGQTDIKRLMAYSSISHMGFALMGLAAGTAFGVQALLIYAVIYVAMNIGTFAFILSMERDGQPVTEIASLNMYASVAPGRALALMVLLFSLAGVPPLVGFFGKLYVLRAAVDAGMIWLAVAGMIAAVIAAYYYLRIVYLMYFGEPREALDGPIAPAQWLALSVSALAMVLGVVNLFGIEALAAAAAAALAG
jgi:NADH-quinone oxidoreductase subunit N